MCKNKCCKRTNRNVRLWVTVNRDRVKLSLKPGMVVSHVEQYDNKKGSISLMIRRWEQDPFVYATVRRTLITLGKYGAHINLSRVKDHASISPGPVSEWSDPWWETDSEIYEKVQ